MNRRVVSEQLEKAHSLTNQAIQALVPLTRRDDDPWTVDADTAIARLREASEVIEDMLDNANSGCYSEAA